LQIPLEQQQHLAMPRQKGRTPVRGAIRHRVDVHLNVRIVLAVGFHLLDAVDVLRTLVGAQTVDVLSDGHDTRLLCACRRHAHDPIDWGYLGVCGWSP
jgi:hypothetical protein